MTKYRGSNSNINYSWYVQQSNNPVEKDEVTQNKEFFLQIRPSTAYYLGRKTTAVYFIL
jgi:hypothetical protein